MLLALYLQLSLSASGGALFSEIGPESGFQFVHDNGMTGKQFLPEIMNGGGALFDFDNDGDLDIFLVQGGPMPGASGPRPGNRLFRNDLRLDGPLRFTDLSARAGVASKGYGMGVAAGDVDNDGDVDLFISNFGANQLLINNGEGVFIDATDRAGLGWAGLSTSATFFDLDRDGDLDLFVADYVEMDLENYPSCFAPDSSADYCGPDAFRAASDHLYLNDGSGHFSDVSGRLLGGQNAAGLGVVAADLDSDGWMDIYVTNDGDPNHLWHNRGDGRFDEIGLLAGVAVNGVGTAEAGMGVTAGDYDGDGDEDLFMTHLNGESNTLYANRGDNIFDDLTNQAGLALPSMRYTGFGTGWLDLNNDGQLDLVVLNGAVRTIPEQASAGVSFPLREPNQIFLNQGGRFKDVSSRGGSAFLKTEVSRGAAIGDVNNDGYPDLLITNGNGPAHMLLNRGGSQAWLGLRLLTADGKRDALGARVVVVTAAKKRLTRTVRTGGSYLSARDPRLLFGLGEESGALSVDVTWPDGKTEQFLLSAVNRYHNLRQGFSAQEDK